MRIPNLFVVAMLVALLPSQRAVAQPYPSAGEIYLSFSESARVNTINTAPNVPFQIWLLVDIPVFAGEPDVGISGVEGSIQLPPELDILQDLTFGPGVLDLGLAYSDPTQRTFVVGLGDCLSLGNPIVLGSIWALLLSEQSDVVVAVDAPSVSAAAISSFAGVGPGWAAFHCDVGGTYNDGLYLFEAPTSATSNLVINPSIVPTSAGSFARLKALY